jgi:ribosomal protein S27E
MPPLRGLRRSRYVLEAVSDFSRYRCTTCGNLTRFDVTSSVRTLAFHHYSVGGELSIEESQVLSESVESVECRWCGPSGSVEELPVTPPA